MSLMLSINCAINVDSQSISYMYNFVPLVGVIIVFINEGRYIFEGLNKILRCVSGNRLYH